MPCQGEGRGFKSLFPLLKPQVTPGFFRVWERVCPLCATQLEWDLLLTSDIDLATIDKGHWVPDIAKAFEKDDFSTVSRGNFSGWRSAPCWAQEFAAPAGNHTEGPVRPLATSDAGSK